MRWLTNQTVDMYCSRWRTKSPRARASEVHGIQPRPRAPVQQARHLPLAGWHWPWAARWGSPVPQESVFILLLGIWLRADTHIRVYHLSCHHYSVRLSWICEQPPWRSVENDEKWRETTILPLGKPIMSTPDIIAVTGTCSLQIRSTYVLMLAHKGLHKY